MSSTHSPRSTADLFMSMLFHTLVLLTLLLSPLYFSDTIDLKGFAALSRRAVYSTTGSPNGANRREGPANSPAGFHDRGQTPGPPPFLRG